MPKPKLLQPLTMREVADLFEVEYSTVSNWIAKGRIEIAGRFGAGPFPAVMFDPAVIAAWGKELRVLYRLRWPEGKG